MCVYVCVWPWIMCARYPEILETAESGLSAVRENVTPHLNDDQFWKAFEIFVSQPPRTGGEIKIQYTKTMFHSV